VSWGQSQSVPVISTRDHFNLTSGKLNDNHNSTDYDFDRKNSSMCYNSTIAIFVHGWNADEFVAAEIFDRVRMSIVANGDNTTVLGFSWDSNTSSPDLNFTAWNNAKIIARDNGPKLAHFVIDYLDNCKIGDETKDIKFISHSLGARILLSSLEYLNSNDTWINKNYKIASVHLMGAAIDNEEISKNINDITSDVTNIGTVKTIAYGQAIENQVINFYNLYNSADNHLEPRIYMQIYPFYENGDLALGQSGHQISPYPMTLSLPHNYAEIDVKNEILPICDADGNKVIDSPFIEGGIISTGDNHHGYMGYRNSADNSKLINDGAINIVIDNWSNIFPTIDQNAKMSAVCKTK
jgi:hypothetical protein